MSNEKENKEAIKRFCNDVFVYHDFSNIDQYMRDDYIQHNADVPQGKAGF